MEKQWSSSKKKLHKNHWIQAYSWSSTHTWNGWLIFVLFLFLFPSLSFPLSLFVLFLISRLCVWGKKASKKREDLQGLYKGIYGHTPSIPFTCSAACSLFVCVSGWKSMCLLSCWPVWVCLITCSSLLRQSRLSVLFCVAFPSSSSPLFFLNFTLCAFLFIPEWLDFLLVYTLVLCLSNWHPTVIIALVCQLIVWSKCKCGHFLTHTWGLHTAVSSLCISFFYLLSISIL